MFVASDIYLKKYLMFVCAEKFLDRGSKQTLNTFLNIYRLQLDSNSYA